LCRRGSRSPASCPFRLSTWPWVRTLLELFKLSNKLPALQQKHPSQSKNIFVSFISYLFLGAIVIFLRSRSGLKIRFRIYGHNLIRIRNTRSPQQYIFFSGSDYSPRTISVLGLEDISPERGPTFPPEEEEEEEVKETHPSELPNLNPVLIIIAILQYKIPPEYRTVPYPTRKFFLETPFFVSKYFWVTPLKELEQISKIRDFLRMRSSSYLPTDSLTLSHI
jgi:hypothetical protein